MQLKAKLLGLGAGRHSLEEKWRCKRGILSGIIWRVGKTRGGCQGLCYGTKVEIAKKFAKA